MEEEFLHFIWRFQQFNSRSLHTDSGQKITVLHPGVKNKDAGPDFKNAKIKIDDIVWNGNVEIHINAKDWYHHNHQNDAAYDNVILHVVWKNDASIQRSDNTVIPTCEVKNLVDNHLIFNYKKLTEPNHDILCREFIGKIRPITIYSMQEKALAQRLEARAEVIFREITLTNNDWEEIAWRMLCKNFGFKTNAHPFEELGKSMPLKILKKEAQRLKIIEALLFGQAGFLEEEVDEGYFMELKQEYRFRKKKYSLERRLDKHQWKFLRLRPANFPTVRIAQLAALITSQKNIFSFFIDTKSVRELRKGLTITQSDYWRNHYNFGLVSKNQLGQFGLSSMDNIIINTAVPLLFAYGIYKDQEELKETALKLLTSVKPEINSATKKWISLGMEVQSSFDSQAFIELFNQFCKKKRCLNCSIGAEIIKAGE